MNFTDTKILLSNYPIIKQNVPFEKNGTKKKSCNMQIYDHEEISFR